MSYPEPRYRGDGGEATATFRSAASEPDLVYPNGTRVHYLANAASTKGLFGLYVWQMDAVPSGPRPHFHRTIDESFYVLTGTVRIYDGREWIDAGPGDVVHVPAGGIHAFRNESGAPASMLLHFAPGAPREGYFEGLAGFARSGQPGDAEMAEFYVSHDNNFV